MGFQKLELTTSINSEEKISTEEHVKENEDSKINTIESSDSTAMISESSDVCFF